MAHTFAADFTFGNFNTAAVALNSFKFYPTVFAAGAFVVLGGAENAFAEQTVALRFQGAVVNGFGFFDFAERPSHNLFRTGNTEFNGIKVKEVQFV